MNTFMRCGRSGTLPHATACLALLIAFAGCGGKSATYRLTAPGAGSTGLSGARFVLLSDTQYAVPFTDYDVRYQLGKQTVELPPDSTTKWVTSFYRHAEAHFALPYAMRDILGRERGRRTFGMFGGDMAEFSCQAETQKIFGVLAEGKELPFIVSIGNHDALFHGSYDTDAVGEAGGGPWDLYSFKLWGSVCEKQGGKLTKAGFIRQLLDYYRTAWNFDFHQALHLDPKENFPLGVTWKGTVTQSGWELAFSFRLSADDSPESHRQSHLYQRWTRRDPSDARSKLTVTVLDTTDFGSRPA